MISLFTEKPAIAPPVFVFQKDKAQKVRRYWYFFSVLFLALPPSFRDQPFVYIVMKLKMANRALTSLMGIGQSGTEGLKVGRCMVVSQNR